MAALFAASASFAQQRPGLKPPSSSAEQKQKYHNQNVVGTDAPTRVKGYEQRLKMEADSPFGGLAWHSVGPEWQGGRVVDIAVPKNDHKSFYVAYATGGLWRTEDQGQSWTPLFDHESAFAIGSIAVTDDGNTLWVGTGENNSQRTSYAGMGVFKSTDRGQTWKNMGLEATERIGRVVVDPKDPNTVYVAAIGHLYSGNPERGVYKTTDGGKSWKQVLKTDDYTGAIDVAISPANSKVVFAAMWQRDRRAWNFLKGGPETAIYKSSDGGDTWAKLGNGLPTGDIGRIGVAISPANPNVVYAFVDNQNGDEDEINKDEAIPSGRLTVRRFRLLTEDQFHELDKDILARFLRSYLPTGSNAEDIAQQVKDKKLSLADVSALMEKRNPSVFQEQYVEQQLYRSDDLGKSWKRMMSGNIGYPQVGYYAGRIVVNPKDSNEVILTGPILIRTTDGGKTWDETGREMHSDFHAYYIDSIDQSFRACGNDGGLYFSYDGGKMWRHVDNMAVGQFATIAVDNRHPFHIYGGLQDNGTMEGPSTYRPGRSNPFDWKDIGGGDGTTVAIDPRQDEDTVYVGFQFGAETRLDRKGNTSGFLNPVPPKDAAKDRWDWVTPLIISSHHPDIIYFGSQRLYRSLDKGVHWEVLSDDLTKNLPNGDVPYSTIKDISESPFKFGLVYVGCDDGTVKVTKDHGGVWEDISTPAKDKWVSRVVASKWDKGTVYAAQTGYREDDFAPYLWKSTDYGKHWTSIVGNLPPEPINVIREDSTRKEFLYVGTDMGVFMSYDAGTSWIPITAGLPHIPVHDIAINADSKTLVIGTHARSAWTFDLSSVYELYDSLRTKDLYIFPVSDETRSSRWGYDRRAAWSSAAPNPMPEPIHVWTNAAGAAQLQVIDKTGKVVKSKELTLTKGWNTTSFDLQIAPGKPVSLEDAKKRSLGTVQDVLADPYAASRPQYLPVGEYKIKIVEGSKTATVDWKIDPE